MVQGGNPGRKSLRSLRVSFFRRRRIRLDFCQRYFLPSVVKHISHKRIVGRDGQGGNLRRRCAGGSAVKGSAVQPVKVRSGAQHKSSGCIFQPHAAVQPVGQPDPGNGFRDFCGNLHTARGSAVRGAVLRCILRILRAGVYFRREK